MSLNKQNNDLDFFGVKYLEAASKIIAAVVCLGLLIASGIVIADAFANLYLLEIETAVQDGLFVLILLEMFYVVRSFIRHGSINVGLVISVGIIAVVKEMIFQLDSLSFQLAGSFALLLLTLGFVYLMEILHFQKKKD